MKQISFLVLVFLLSYHPVDAQLFKKLKNRTEQKIKERAERKIVEGVSEELARRAMKPLDNAFDDMFRESYKEQYGQEYDDSEYEGNPQEAQAKRMEVLNQMFGNVQLPEKYEFGYQVDIEITNFGEKKPEKMKMLIDPENGTFGMQQNRDGVENTMVFDSKNDLVAIFNEKDKTVMAIPNVTKMAAVYGKQAMENAESKMIRFEKLNKNKKILGYLCDGYESESEEYQSDFYVTDKLPFSWSDTFGSLAKNVSPNFYKDNPEYNINGMLMEGTTKNKENDEKSYWEVKKISDKTQKVDCSDYALQNMMAGK